MPTFSATLRSPRSLTVLACLLLAGSTVGLSALETPEKVAPEVTPEEAVPSLTEAERKAVLATRIPTMDERARTLDSRADALGDRADALGERAATLSDRAAILNDRVWGAAEPESGDLHDPDDALD